MNVINVLTIGKESVDYVGIWNMYIDIQTTNESSSSNDATFRSMWTWIISHLLYN